jgi:hypothetical protein
MVQQRRFNPFSIRQSETSVISPVSCFNETFGDWQIRKDILHLGNGAFGACPTSVIESPTSWQLLCLAQSRIRRIVTSGFASYPLAIFPTTRDNETQFPLAIGTKYQHVNLEASRMTYMLSYLPRRRIPAMMASFIEELLEAEDVIERWPDLVETLKSQAQILSRSIVFDMTAPRTPEKYPNNDGDFVNRVLPYETENCEKNTSLTFWRRALDDFTTRSPSSPARVTAFLQIHSFLKDPTGGLYGDFEKQTDLFLFLINGLKSEVDVDQLGRDTWEEIIAQLALESSFLSQPLVSNTSYIHFEEDQQLVYSYVDMFSLVRSEFACPEIIVGLINEILDSDSDECCIAPIAVSHFHPVCSDQGTRILIVDGNNRITTLTFLRFVATYGLSDLERTENQLRQFCQDTGLGPVSFVDFCAVVKILRNGGSETMERLQSCNLRRFKNISQVPILITQVSSFFTKVLVDNKEDIAQPVHQYIFATDDLLVAFPAKTQSHERAKGFRALPVR